MKQAGLTSFTTLSPTKDAVLTKSANIKTKQKPTKY